MFNKGARETPSTLSTFEDEGGGVDVMVKLPHVGPIGNCQERVVLDGYR